MPPGPDAVRQARELRAATALWEAVKASALPERSLARGATRGSAAATVPAAKRDEIAPDRAASPAAGRGAADRAASGGCAFQPSLDTESIDCRTRRPTGTRSRTPDIPDIGPHRAVPRRQEADLRELPSSAESGHGGSPSLRRGLGRSGRPADRIRNGRTARRLPTSLLPEGRSSLEGSDVA